MKFEINTTDLSEVLDVANSGPREAVHMFRLKVADGQLSATIDNRDLSITAIADVTEQEPGECNVPDRLARVIKSKAVGNLTISLEDDHLKVSDATSTTEIECRTLGEPNIAHTSEGEVEVDFDFFRELMDRVVPSAATTVDRPVLACVPLEVEDHHLRAVATNSFRLSILDFHSYRDNPDFTGLVPARLLRALEPLLDYGPVTVAKTEKVVTVRNGTLTISAPIPEHQFPGYRQLIPDDESATGTLAFKTEDMTAAITSVATMSAPGPGVRLELEGDSTLTISGSILDMGRSSARVPVDLTGEWPATFNFRPDYLLDAIKAVGSDRVTISSTAPEKPLTIKAADYRDRDLTYLLMPIRVS